MTLALTIGVLFGGSVYLMLQRDRLRVILGFVLLGHACNLLIFSAGGIVRRDEPLGSDPDPAVTADPLPQAFVLTAIVIAFAITVYLLVLAVTGPKGEDAPEETREDGTTPAAVGTLEDRYDVFGEPAGSADPHSPLGGPPGTEGPAVERERVGVGSDHPGDRSRGIGEVRG